MKDASSSSCSLEIVVNHLFSLLFLLVRRESRAYGNDVLIVHSNTRRGEGTVGHGHGHYFCVAVIYFRGGNAPRKCLRLITFRQGDLSEKDTPN